MGLHDARELCVKSEICFLVLSDLKYKFLHYFMTYLVFIKRDILFILEFLRTLLELS